MSNFKKGDVVQLKSGGPAMTVANVAADGELDCQWFDNAGKLQRSFFQSEAVCQYEEPTPIF